MLLTTKTACRRRGPGDAFAQFGQRAEFVVAHAQAVARLAGVDGVGAKIEGGAHHFKRAGGGEQFGAVRGRGHSKILKKPRILSTS